MEDAHKKHNYRLRHKKEDCQVPDFKVASDDALAEGEDLAADLAVELLVEEQRLSKGIGR